MLRQNRCLVPDILDISHVGPMPPPDKNVTKTLSPMVAQRSLLVSLAPKLNEHERRLTNKTPAQKGNERSSEKEDKRQQDRPLVMSPAKDQTCPESCHGVDSADKDECPVGGEPPDVYLEKGEESHACLAFSRSPISQ